MHLISNTEPQNIWEEQVSRNLVQPLIVWRREMPWSELHGCLMAD